MFIRCSVQTHVLYTGGAFINLLTTSLLSCEVLFQSLTSKNIKLYLILQFMQKHIEFGSAYL